MRPKMHRDPNRPLKINSNEARLDRQSRALIVTISSASGGNGRREPHPIMRASA
ncbi:hypothetical protein [Microvirga lenta]|uniref:hypothetical protein n=1 Tax=Microvirga lenta TaxID=2881337 RepID=UPI001CFCF50C|nr:hypothetical protein [Microvirga lenta]MCB5173661.1 hypothetical protein [Microvirga lenta]